MLDNKTVAFVAWKKLLGESRVIELDSDAKGYVSVGRITPANQQQVSEVLAVARQYNVPLYPISTGKNWGYGGFAPSAKGSVILDLSHLNKIISFDSQLGLVRVEPGVTMGQLRDFLHNTSAPFLSPHTGAEPAVSIIGNLLEKGRSSVSFVDRASSLVSLKALLADGSMYESPSSFFKWGVGPYVDGLFLQSNIGVVLEATVALARKPTKMQGFYLPIKIDVSLDVLIDLVRECQAELGSTLVSFSIQNKERLSTRGQVVESRLRLDNEWVLLGVLGGDPTMVHAARFLIMNRFKKVALRRFFFTKTKLDFIQAVHNFSSLFKWPYFFQQLEPMFRSLIESAEGRGEGGMGFLQKDKIDYAGLLFVPIVVPVVGSVVSPFYTGAHRICAKYGVSFSVSFLSFTSTSLLFSLLIVFDPKIAEEKEKAHQCYIELVEFAEKNNCLLYRASTSAMGVVRNNHTSFWEVAKKIKIALDPQDILSPGRYVPPIR